METVKVVVQIKDPLPLSGLAQGDEVEFKLVSVKIGEIPVHGQSLILELEPKKKQA